MRQTAAAERLEASLRCLELIVAAGGDRHLKLALDDVDAAFERLTSLELARTLAVTSLGLPAEADIGDLMAAQADQDQAARLHGERERLRQAMDRVEDARQRARRVVGAAAARTAERLAAARSLSGSPA